ncbi:MAG: molybdopterin-guanine dinucleotide biosynthesis protein B [Rhizobiaceae bacterium]
MSRLFGIVGWKNSGKTTLVAALVSELTARGLKVSTVKHAHHNFAFDKEGTDSFRHREAGAHEVALVSSKRWAIIHENTTESEEPSLENIISKLGPCDLILVEGYKNSNIQKIETIRQDYQKETALWQTHEGVVGVASDASIQGCDKPQFQLDDVSGIADFIIQISGVRV